MLAASTKDEDARWQAVQNRDRRADGAFFYAVSSTGIYCRPTCPAKRPQRPNVQFFRTARDAQHAGYRPCRRCKPDEVSSQQRTVAQVKRLVEQSEAIPTLERLGQKVGMSPYHVQRIFKRHTGLSPKQYGVAVRAERLRRGLRAGSSVTDAAHEAGYGSSRSVYDTAGAQLGLLPSEYGSGGRGRCIRYGLVESPLGTMVLAASERGVCALWFGEAQELIAEGHRGQVTLRNRQTGQGCVARLTLPLHNNNS